MKTLGLICLIVGITVLSASCGISNKNKSPESFPSKSETNSSSARQNNATESSTPGLRSRLSQAMKYIKQNGYSTEYCFLVDMGIHSGKNRFFVYDMKKNTVSVSGLVAHGTCNTQFLAQAKFSNTPSCGCSSLGKYKIGASYRGQYGKSYRLYGLEASNSNAYKRAVVLHGFNCVPDQEIYPRVLCNSLGCPMVSQRFFSKLSGIIDRSEKPILLWVYI